MSDELCFLSAAEAGRKIAAKELSSVELTEALMLRTEAIDGRLNAYIRVLGDQARAAAAAHFARRFHLSFALGRARRPRGRRRGARRGPACGASRSFHWRRRAPRIDEKC